MKKVNEVYEGTMSLFDNLTEGDISSEKEVKDCKKEVPDSTIEKPDIGLLNDKNSVIVSINTQEWIEKNSQRGYHHVEFTRTVFDTDIPLDIDYYDALDIATYYVEEILAKEIGFGMADSTNAFDAVEAYENYVIFDIKLMNRGIKNEFYQIVVFATGWIPMDSNKSYSKRKMIERLYEIRRIGNDFRSKRIRQKDLSKK